MKRIALFFLITISTTLLKAQLRQEIFNIRWFNTENGLPANGIKGIQWDPETELIWIATEAGVVRFNGVEFSLFTRNNSPVLASERINFIVKNHKEIIFSSDNEGNSFFIDKNRLVSYNKVDTKNELDSRALFGLAVSEKYFQLLKKNNPAIPFALPFDKIASLDEYSALIAQAGEVILTDLRNNKTEPLKYLPKKIKNLFKTQTGIYLIDNLNGVLKLSLKEKKSIKIPLRLEGRLKKDEVPEQAEFFWENGQQYPILIHENKAWKISESNGQLVGKLICSQVPNDALIKHFLYLEDKGLIIIGTDSKGIAVLLKNTVIPIRKSNLTNLASNSYYSQLELKNGEILTGQGHILGEKPKPISPPIIGIFSNSVYLTQDSILWYQQYSPQFKAGTIFSYNFKTGNRELQYPTKKGNSFAIWDLRDTTFLFTAEEILQIRPTKNILHKLPVDKTLKSDPITSVVLDKENIAIASCNGLVIFNRKLNQTDTILSLPNYCIRSLIKQGDYLLIGTYGDGLYIHKINEGTKKIPIDKKNCALYAHCFVVDAFGFCWISTNRGLLKARMNDLVDAYQNPQKEIYYQYYGIIDGMITSEMNGGCHPCAIKLKNGYISFPTMDGLLWVEPKPLQPSKLKSELYIDEVSINEIPLKSPNTEFAKLPFSTKQISIKLAYPAWSNQENIYLYYRLKETEPWKEISYNNPSLLEINNIEPGSYQLQIRKLNGFGSNNFTLLSLPFEIETPWFKKWWFYLSCAALLYGLILLYFYFRTRRLQLSERKLRKLVEDKTIELKLQNQTLEKNNRIMGRLISIISHDIVTPLKFIHVAGKNLLKNKKELTSELKDEAINEITNTAQELQNLSTNILNWIRFQRKNRLLEKVDFFPYEIAEQVTKVLGASARIKNLQLENKISPDLLIHQYAEPFRILLHNLVSNAINFSEKGTIEITLEKHPSVYQLKVKDQGVGMTPDQIENILKEELIISSATVDNRKGHGLGYQIIKDLIELIEAKININSQKNSGTTVTITLKANT